MMKKNTSIKESVFVAHAVAGRVRLQFENDTQHEPNIDTFLAIRGVDEVAFNNITKSLVIVYDENILSQYKLFKEIKKILPTIALCLPSEKKHHNNAQTNVLGHIMYSALRHINTNTHRTFKGYADLTSVVPTFFLLWGLEELVRKPVMPKWYDILRAADSMFTSYKNDYPVS